MVLVRFSVGPTGQSTNEILKNPQKCYYITDYDSFFRSICMKDKIILGHIAKTYLCFYRLSCFEAIIKKYSRNEINHTRTDCKIESHVHINLLPSFDHLII